MLHAHKDMRVDTETVVNDFVGRSSEKQTCDFNFIFSLNIIKYFIKKNEKKR